MAPCRVVVTRAADRSDELVELLRAHGYVPVVVPLVTTEVVDAELDRLRLLDPSNFDWLVVTSATAARVYASVHSEVPPLVAAVGTTTAASVRAAGHGVDLVPEMQRAASLVDAFPVGSGRVLVVQAVDGADVLVDGLVRRGWSVEVVRPYRTVTAPPTDDLRRAAADADAVLFASGSAARAWVDVFGVTTPPVVVVIGPQTADDTRRAGLTVTVVAEEHSLGGMVEALERHLRCLP